MSDGHVYRITFLQQGQVYEIYSEGVGQGGMLGFVEVDGLLFGERTEIVVDPSEERLKTEFQGVRRLYLPMHSILRIEEVEKRGTARIRKAEKGEANLMQFPVPMTVPESDPNSK